MNNILSEKDTKAVFDIIINQLGVQEAQLTPDARIQEDLCADSLDVMEIIMAMEERFNISIPDEIYDRVSTVGELIEALADLVGGPEERRLAG